MNKKKKTIGRNTKAGKVSLNKAFLLLNFIQLSDGRFWKRRIHPFTKTEYIRLT
jgi:hypothetical protein